MSWAPWGPTRGTSSPRPRSLATWATRGASTGGLLPSTARARRPSRGRSSQATPHVSTVLCYHLGLAVFLCFLQGAIAPYIYVYGKGTTTISGSVFTSNTACEYCTVLCYDLGLPVFACHRFCRPWMMLLPTTSTPGQPLSSSVQHCVSSHNTVWYATAKSTCSQQPFIDSPQSCAIVFWPMQCSTLLCMPVVSSPQC